MKTITRFLFLIAPVILLNTSVAKAQACIPGFTWNQSANNVIDFTNTSTPIIANSTFFSWNFGDNQYAWQQSPSHTYAAPGSYVVCVTMYDSLSSCQATFCDSITVYGNVLCTATVSANVISPASCSTCADGSAYGTMYGGTAPYTYSWSNGQTTQTATGLAPGSYTVCITDANGCSACNSVTVPYQNTNCNASFTWSQSQNNIIDFVNTSNNSTNGYTLYTWDFGDGNYGYSNSVNNMSHTYQNPGTYMVCLYFVDSLTACSSSYCDSVTVYGNTMSTACNANFVIYPDSNNTQQAWAYNLSTGGPGMTYDWNWGDNTPHDYVAYPSHVYQSTGTYNICLIVTDAANQCSDTMCVTINVFRLSQQAAQVPYYVNVLPMGIHEQTQVNWSLFPNPASTVLTIRTEYNLQNRKYHILDIAGRTIIANTIDGNKIDVSSLDKGMYILQIEDSKGGFSAQRFMKD
ncbi:MAG TPA: PKD domain-containing protein [Bacteroidia bacterium]|nr:PKD domain-containing protein [Bacteroidia bacterium]